MSRKIEQTEESSTVLQTFSKVLRRNASWNDKDEILDAVYWGRQILSLIIGIAMGITPLKGLLAILLYIVISTFTAHFYVTSYQSLDDEELGGFMEIAKEGFGAAFATFMISWITVYSAIHFE